VGPRAGLGVCVKNSPYLSVKETTTKADSVKLWLHFKLKLTATITSLDFKRSLCSECCMLSSGRFISICSLIEVYFVPTRL
jgi:hypothetical protein